MKTALIRIGNSRGIRIPKPLVEQCGLAGEVELTVKAGALLVTPARAARAGWDEAFAASRARRRVAPPLPVHSLDRWESKEWKW
jgi:antitoxin MazE